jgi:hypothetical protein
LDKLFAWLRIEPKGWALLLFFAAILIYKLLYAFLSEKIIQYLGIHIDVDPTLDAFAKKMPLTLMFIFLPIFAMFEEFLFRLPLMFLGIPTFLWVTT